MCASRFTTDVPDKALSLTGVAAGTGIASSRRVATNLSIPPLALTEKCFNGSPDKVGCADHVVKLVKACVGAALFHFFGVTAPPPVVPPVDTKRPISLAAVARPIPPNSTRTRSSGLFVAARIVRESLVVERVAL